MRKNAPMAIALLVAESLLGCGSDSRPNDGINEEAAKESTKRRDYGNDDTWQGQDSNYQNEASQKKHEQGNTTGDDGTLGDKKNENQENK